MTVLGRILLFLLALLLIGVPVLLLLVNYGAVSERPIEILNEQLFQPLDGVEGADFTGPVRLIVGLLGLAVALLVGLVLLLMMRQTAVSAKDAVIEDEPGAEVVLRPHAVEHLAEGAARAAGAGSPRAHLASHDGAHDIVIDFRARRLRDLPGQAAAVQDRVREDLVAQGLQPGKVEVMLVDTIPTSRVE